MAVSAGKQYENTNYYMKDPVFSKDNGVLLGSLHRTLGFKGKLNAKMLRALQK